MFDPEAGAMVINETDIDTKSVYDALVGPHPEIATLIRWTITTRGDMSMSRQQGIFARDRFVTPTRIFDQFDTARDAATSDDIVSGVIESTESLAFGRISFSCLDEEEEDLWDQIAFDLDLENRIREMWRELFICSQFYCVTWWGQKSYKLRGTTLSGNKRRKSFDNLTVPMGMTLLDPKKVVPVGNLMFNQDQLAYIADRTEVDMLDAAVLNDPQADPVSRQIIVAKYAPPDYERRNLAKQGINADWLYILNPRNVWRHTLTRSQFQRWADVRMVSIFELLDLKHQLRQMDRAHLIGGTNFIVLVKKGTENHPAKPDEINNLKDQVTSVARVPIMVGDHRLSVEIITPKVDYTLNGEKYATIDQRLTTRLYQMFLVHGGAGAVRGDDSIKLAKIIARGLESRRNDLRRTLERQVLGPMMMANAQLNDAAKLRFHPTHVTLDFDPAWVQVLLDVRDRGDLSRDSMLNELDFDQHDEARQRQREAEQFDDTFQPTIVPFSNPRGAGRPSDGSGTGSDNGGVKAPVDTKAAGRRTGGTRNGGGAAPGTGQGQAPRDGKAKTS